MKTVLALLMATALGARAEEARPAPHAHGSDSGLVLLDIFLDVLTLGIEVAAIENATHPPPPEPRMAQPARSQQSQEDEDGPRPWRAARRPQAREGLLLSFGIGGGSMFVSDRFQLFMDIDLAGGKYPYGDDIGSWAFTLRGQTVLVGDRAGNGLNLNLGIGTGGITRNSGYYGYQEDSASGLALAGGLSYDARISPWFALSPEFFVTWHAIPNGPRLPQDVASIYGIRLNFLWYLH